MEFDEEFELGHLLFNERKCRTCNKKKDLLTDIYKHFDEYGAEYFEQLDIWHVPQLRNYFIKETARRPR